MKPKKKEIKELSSLEDIEECEQKFEKEYGFKPINISTWNPSDYFKKNFLLNKIKLYTFDFIPYIYSNELDQNLLNKVKRKLGVSREMESIICNTGTSAITLVVSVLKELNIKKILIICPTYYSAIYNFYQKGIEVEKMYMDHCNNEYFLPIKKILSKLNSFDAVWITSPIYNTSTYLKKSDVNFLTRIIPKQIFIICDDCFATKGKEFSRNLISNNNFIIINDPLKQIMVNGLKFAVITCSNNIIEIFNKWSDIICGSLSYSTIQSINFFLSNEYNEVVDDIHYYLTKVSEKLENIINQFPNVEIDKNTEGHMIMCYLPQIESNYFIDKSKIYDFIQKTNVSIIPGSRFHFSSNDGFCFRINLGRTNEEFWDALYRVLDFFYVI